MELTKEQIKLLIDLTDGELTEDEIKALSEEVAEQLKNLECADESRDIVTNIIIPFSKISIEKKLGAATMILGETLFSLREELPDEVDEMWQLVIDKAMTHAQRLHNKKLEAMNA